QGAGAWPLRSSLRARISGRPGSREPRRALGRASSRLAVHVRDRLLARLSGLGAAPPAAGVPAVARGAWAPRRGGSRNGADRVRNRHGHGGAVAARQAGRLHARQASLADRLVWSVLSAANFGRLGVLVLRLFLQLCPLHLAPQTEEHTSKLQSPY